MTGRVRRIPRWAWSWGRGTCYTLDGREAGRFLCLGPIAIRLTAPARD